MDLVYDVIIIGGGPAGLSAAIYAARDRLKTLVFEKASVGGNTLNAVDVDNYPGFPQGINGFELMERMHEQASKHGADIQYDEVLSLEKIENIISVRTNLAQLQTRAVVIAAGTERGKLGVPGESKYAGKGVSYCATCDGPFFKNKEVAIIGGGNAALYEALHLANFASRVKLVHRRDEFRATRAVQEKVFEHPGIDTIMSQVVMSIEGDDKVRSMKIKNTRDGSVSEIPIDGVFVAVGLKPNSEFARDLLTVDSQGSIVIDGHMQTTSTGIFAAGDVCAGSIRQIVAAAGDGAKAAVHVRDYLGS